jgi:hypothetical protein
MKGFKSQRMVLSNVENDLSMVLIIGKLTTLYHILDFSFEERIGQKITSRILELVKYSIIPAHLIFPHGSGDCLEVNKIIPLIDLHVI